MAPEPPHNDDAERIVLGAMMTAPEAIETVTDRITGASYYRPHHATIHAYITAAWAAGEPTEPVALLARMSPEDDRRIGGATYLHECVEVVPTAVQAGHYADLVADAAHCRGLLEEASRLQQAAEISDHAQRAERVETIRSALANAASPTVSRQGRAEPIEWATFLTRDVAPVEFMVGRLMVRGQQISLVGDGKAGKSLLALEWAWRIAAGLEFLGDSARSPLRVLYVDQENTDDDIQERLLSIGATAETLANLTYLSFPSFRPLNNADGAADLLAVVDQYKPAVVFLDTISRMINGKENDADPWLDLYRRAIMPLKAKKISSVRLDHFGKDQSRGGRGNSAKTQDVDAVYELVPVERGSSLLDLTRTHTRSGKGPESLLIRRHGEQVGDRWKTGGTWHGVAGEDERPETEPDPGKQYRPAALRVLGVLGVAEEPTPMTVAQIGDELAEQPKGPLKERTIQDALKTLTDAGEVEAVEALPGKAGRWQVIKS